MGFYDFDVKLLWFRSQNPVIAFCGGAHIIKDPKVDPKPTDMLQFCNFISKEDQTLAVCLMYPKNSLSCDKFLEHMSKDNLGSNIVEALVYNLENVFVSPTWWKNLKHSDKELLKNHAAVIVERGILDKFSENKLVDWEFLHEKTICL